MFEVGDVNEDAKVDEKDIDTIINHFGENNTKFDLNRDGKVDIVRMRRRYRCFCATRYAFLISEKRSIPRLPT